MNTSATPVCQPARLQFSLFRWHFSIPQCLSQRPELLVFILLIAVFNFPVLTGSYFQSLIFQPEAIHSGQWWRLVTHPFVHVTWYHLLLDGSAFLILYHSLLESSLFRRLGYILAGDAVSLLLAWATASPAGSLCGLSGIAHGLMAVSALELVARHPARSPDHRVGLITFIFVIGKAAFEALTGRMFFGFLDFGLLGNPVAVSHAGGIIGSLLLLFCLRAFTPIDAAGNTRAKPLPDCSKNHQHNPSESLGLLGMPCRAAQPYTSEEAPQPFRDPNERRDSTFATLRSPMPQCPAHPIRGEMQRVAIPSFAPPTSAE